MRAAVLSLDGFRGDAPAMLGPPARLLVVRESLRLIAPRPVPRSFQVSRVPPAS
jgi:hypothetical protein